MLHFCTWKNIDFFCKKNSSSVRKLMYLLEKCTLDTEVWTNWFHISVFFQTLFLPECEYNFGSFPEKQNNKTNLEAEYK